MRKLGRSLTCAAIVLLAPGAGAQSNGAVTVDDSLLKLTSRTPHAKRAAAYKQLCPGAYEDDTGVIIGRVRDVDDSTPLADATISTKWTEIVGTARHSTSKPVRAQAQTNAQGIYVLCGVPTTDWLEVHADIAGVRAGPALLLLNDRLIARADLAVSRRDTASRALALADSTTVAGGVPGTASLRGTVLGDNGRSMRDATVSIIGTQRSAHTDVDGTFRIDHIPAGTRTVEVRYVGLLPMIAALEFATNGARDTLFSIGKKAQLLNPVAVRAELTLPSWMERSGFEDRRKVGLGGFVTEEEIKRHTYPELVTVLEGVRGVRVEFRLVMGVMGIPFMLSGGRRCSPNFFLDGTYQPVDFPQLSGFVTPEQIKGIEAYSSPGTVPPQFDMFTSTHCGSIVIWTR